MTYLFTNNQEVKNDVGNPLPVVVAAPAPILPALGAADFYGEPYAIPITPVLQINSYEGIRARSVQIYETLGATVYENDTDIAMVTTTTPGSFAVYRSRRFIPFRPGQTNLARILCKFGAPVVGTTQRVGIQNVESAYYVGYDSAGVFQFLHVYGGRVEVRQLTLTGTASANQTLTVTLNSVAYTVNILSGDTANQAAQRVSLVLEASTPVWAGTQIDNTVEIVAGGPGPRTGTYSVTSTGNITGVIVQRIAGVAATEEWEPLTVPVFQPVTEYNHWQFQYSWNGILVYTLDHANNRWRLLHRHVGVHGAGDQLPVRKPTFKVASLVANYNAASTVQLRVASLFGAAEGSENITSYTWGGGTTMASLATGTYWHVMSIQNPYLTLTDDFKLNFRSIRLMDLTVSAQCNDPVEVYLYLNQQLVSPAVFDFRSYPGAIYQIDTTTKTAMNISGDSPILSVVAGVSGAITQFDLLPYNMVIPPGAHISVVVFSASVIQKISVAGTWEVTG